MIKSKVYTRITEPDPALVQRIGDIGVADLHEGLGGALGRTLLMEAAMRPLDRTRKIVGPAVTAYNFPGDNLATHIGLHVAGPGHVLVSTNGGGVQGALIGDLLGQEAMKKGLAGLVCEGSVRDTQSLVAMGCPVWSTSIHVSHPEKRGPVLVNVPIVAGGVTVNPGDIIVADADGVLVIPPELLEVAFENAGRRSAREITVRERMQNGEELYEILETSRAASAAAVEIFDELWRPGI